MNDFSAAEFDRLDDLLAFVSIYDDDNRTQAYFNLLDKNVKNIRDKVCVEAGCGFGILAEHLAQLGAKKVYAVEANQHLYDIAAHRLSSYRNVELVCADIRDFSPREPVHLLVHEFFGQLLLDEDIYVLDQLTFVPKVILPNQARLNISVLPASEFVDACVTQIVLEKLKGALVAGLFDANNVQPEQLILTWQPGLKTYQTIVDIHDSPGDVLCFGLEIYHDDSFVCRAGECDNWSLVWTPRAGDQFLLKFTPANRGTFVQFRWLK
ncbi:class I SAM-dependent methyltransferase [candidate division KSB1 bacterium]|nr:class I SAM-dependent methyltransferase [candidate division KSB1 bacterium]